MAKFARKNSEQVDMRLEKTNIKYELVGNSQNGVAFLQMDFDHSWRRQ